MSKNIRNANKVTSKLRPALIKATNYRLEVARDKERNRKKMIKRQKTEVIAAKHFSNRREIRLFNGKKENYEGDIGDDTDLD